MKVINAATYPTTNLSKELESRRDHRDPRVSAAVVKRQIRRQVRQHLAVELRDEVHQLHVDAAARAANLAVARRSVNRMVDSIVKDLDRPVKAPKTVVPSYGLQMPKPERKVMVTRKLGDDPFKRKHIEVTVLVA